MPTRFALQGWLPRLFRGWWILGSRKRSSLIISHLSQGSRFSWKKHRLKRAQLQTWEMWVFAMASFGPLIFCFFGDLSTFFLVPKHWEKIQCITKTQNGITDIFCWLTFSFVAWKFHESIRVIFHGLSLVNMLLLSDASRVPEKTTSNQPPPELAEERQRKTPHTSVSRSVFWVHPTVVEEKDVENQEYHPQISCTLGHLIASLNIYLPQLLCPATVQGSWGRELQRG